MSNTTIKDYDDSKAILLMHCPDQPGIIASITDFITTNKGNIVYLDQHVDHEDKIFFIRIEWELKHFSIPRERISEYFETLYGRRYQMYFRIYFSDYKPRMAIFVSKMSHCLYDILARYISGEWNVDIPVIISNHEDLATAAARFGIPYRYIPFTKQTSAKQAKVIIDTLKEFDIDSVVLARYMQIIPPEIIELYPHNIINIHHSFLPAFIGARPYHAAYERGVKLIGATSHYVTSELDAGPIIEQDIVRISHKDTVKDIIHKGRDLEKIVLSHAVEKQIERKILTYMNKTIIFN